MRCVALWAIVLLGLVGSDAAAQVNNSAAAEALFLEGRTLMQAKNFAKAAEKFAASDRAEASVGARISLGDCYKALGKTASAWSSYKAAVNLARQKQDSRRAASAEKQAKTVEPLLVYVQITVAAPVAGLEVAIDGNAVSAALFGQRIPVDPGTLEVSATAPGFKAFATKVTARKTGAAVAVSIPALTSTTKPDPNPDDKPDPTPDPDPDVTPDPVPDPIAADPGTDDPGRGRRLIGLGVGAAGLVGLGVGLAFGASANSKWNKAFDDGLCDERTNVCNTDGQALTDSARSRATVSTIAVIGGAVLVGAGVVLYLTAPSSEESERSARIAPVIGDRDFRLALSGQF